MHIIRTSLLPSASMQPGITNDPNTHDDRHMPCPVTPKLSCKRRQPEQGPYNTSQHQLKRQKLNPPAPAYWDNLSEIWLTKRALRELDQRNSCLRPPQKYQKPVFQRSCLQLKSRCGLQLAADPLRDCSPECLKQIRRSSRLGGPDLSDLRNYPNPESILERPMTSKSDPRSRKRRAGSPSSKTRNTGPTTTSRSSTPYSRNFQQNLTDHGIYPPEYRYPNGEKMLRPNNWDEIKERLRNPRQSLSPSRFSEKELEEFREADAYASKEKPVTTTVIPTIEGDICDSKCTGGGYLFGNLAHLTDGTLAQAKPDHFYGARPEQLNRQIRKELSNQIIPSTQDDLPMVPNFFLEAKGPDGSLAVATRQACYDGAIGARGMQSLQSYRQDKLTYDNNAYTITSIYHGGQLKLYTTHISEPRGPGCRPEYIMTLLNGWSMAGDAETFRQGASAYRNARDWAKEMRDKFITAANEHLSDAQLQNQTASSVALSDALTVPDETEYQDAQWSFAAPIEGGEEEFQPLSRNPKKQRVDSRASCDPASNNPAACPN